uniref:Uncharacterized protein n=1 Tax=Rhizophora mucronata TaxID=61149 RepID=A0A2P2QVJ5_RHIMU
MIELIFLDILCWRPRFHILSLSFVVAVEIEFHTCLDMIMCVLLN